MPAHNPPPWRGSPHRARLLDLYARADALLHEWTCSCAPPQGEDLAAPCCRFAVTGREPYPTAVELEEVRHAVRQGSVMPRESRRLPLAAGCPCPLLSDDGRCQIYASRPFGCRTYFCSEAEGHGLSRWPRGAINAIGRQIADLAASFAPRDPGPRPLRRALASKRR